MKELKLAIILSAISLLSISLVLPKDAALATIPKQAEYKEEVFFADIEAIILTTLQSGDMHFYKSPYPFIPNGQYIHDMTESIIKELTGIKVESGYKDESYQNKQNKLIIRIVFNVEKLKKQDEELLVGSVYTVLERPLPPDIEDNSRISGLYRFKQIPYSFVLSKDIAESKASVEAAIRRSLKVSLDKIKKFTVPNDRR